MEKRLGREDGGVGVGRKWREGVRRSGWVERERRMERKRLGGRRVGREGELDSEGEEGTKGEWGVGKKMEGEDEKEKGTRKEDRENGMGGGDGTQ